MTPLQAIHTYKSRSQINNSGQSAAESLLVLGRTVCSHVKRDTVH